MVRLVQISSADKKNAIVISVAIGFFTLLACFSLYKWFFLNIKQPAELFFAIMFLFVLLERARAKYTYEAHDKHIRFIKHGLFNTKEYEVPYKSVLGFYLYKPQLISAIQYRKTYRLHSALEHKDVWTLAHEVTEPNGKKVNYRIFFKPNNDMLALFDEILPGKVIRQDVPH
jgi:hypothetical protein